GIVVVVLADRLVRGLGGEEGDELWASLALSFFSPVTSPALRDGSVFVADLGGGLYRFDSEDGVRAWSYQFNEVVLRSSPVVSGAWVLLGLNDGRLVAVNGESGRLAWQSAASGGLIGTIALSPEAIVAVKGGAEGGLIAFEHDPDGRLVDIPSPTELDGGTTLARIGAAAAIALAVLLVPGILLRRRFGDAFATEGEDDGLEPDEEEVES
ncbi:MAG: PQQ-binding-like beta-propeller repeat protein, partial [Actinomycetota bacterium]